MQSPQRDLTEALRLAALGGAAEKNLFYRVLLASSVVVPLRPGAADFDPMNSVIGGNAFEQQGFVVVEQDGRRKLPCFSDQSLFEKWAEERFASSDRTFSSLCATSPDDVWIHLDPGSDYGKEISPWEIDRLRRGEAAIEEVISESEELGLAHEIAVIPDGERFPEMRRRFISILEAYEDVREAFLVYVDDESSEDEPFPVLGLKHNGIPTERLAVLRTELLSASVPSLAPNQVLSIVDDLGAPGCRFAEIFEDVKPFYFATSGNVPLSLWDKVSRLFGIVRS